MAKINELGPGRVPTREQFNLLAKEVNRQAKLSGRNGITVNSSPAGVSLIGAAGAAVADRRAFAKTAAGSGSTIVCFLDTDTTGTEVTVDCDIAGGSDLNAAIPRLVDGTPMYVVADATASAGWRSKTLFQATQDCA